MPALASSIDYFAVMYSYLLCSAGVQDIKIPEQRPAFGVIPTTGQDA